MARQFKPRSNNDKKNIFVPQGGNRTTFDSTNNWYRRAGCAFSGLTCSKDDEKEERARNDAIKRKGFTVPVPGSTTNNQNCKSTSYSTVIKMN